MSMMFILKEINYFSNSAADVTINADGSCGNGWICEHRWNVHQKMVLFRNNVQGTKLENYWNNGQAVAFSRGNVGFFAMAKDNGMNENLQTGSLFFFLIVRINRIKLINQVCLLVPTATSLTIAPLN